MFTFYKWNDSHRTTTEHQQKTLGSEKTRKPPYNLIGQKGEKRRNRMGPAPQGGSYEGGNVLAPKEVSSLVGKLDWTEGELWSLGGEHGNQIMEGK